MTPRQRPAAQKAVVMRYKRMPIEIESPEQMGYEKIRNNLAESSYTDALLRDIGVTETDLRDLVLCYGSHQGHEGLRELIARSPSMSVSGLTADDVLLTIGAAGALFIVATTLLEPDDELVVVRPNYATNLETPRAIGANLRYIDLRFEEDWLPDAEVLGKALSSKTKYISVTNPHNPTGACLPAETLVTLTALAEAKGIRLLVDETYRDLNFDSPSALAAAASPAVISVSSISKAYGLPGLRTGWIVCRDRQLMEEFLAAKEQMYICGPALEEELAYRYLLHRGDHLARIRRDIREKFRIVESWMQGQEDWEWVEPRGGCVCFPRLKRPDLTDIDRFYEILRKKYGTYAGPGHWFEMPQHYMRLGFGWPDKESLKEGLGAISKATGEAKRRY
jgi:aspartate/methionine/tyrosine aminotransferase